MKGGQNLVLGSDASNESEEICSDEMLPTKMGRFAKNDASKKVANRAHYVSGGRYLLELGRNRFNSWTTLGNGKREGKDGG